MMVDLRRTEVDGLHAMWHVAQHHLVTITGVESASDSSCVLRFDPGNCPDLAAARELYPELARLWDAVRHEFWRHLIP